MKRVVTYKSEEGANGLWSYLISTATDCDWLFYNVNISSALITKAYSCQNTLNINSKHLTIAFHPRGYLLITCINYPCLPHNQYNTIQPKYYQANSEPFIWFQQQTLCDFHIIGVSIPACCTGNDLIGYTQAEINVKQYVDDCENQSTLGASWEPHLC